MRVNANIFWLLTAFFALVATAYTVWVLLDNANTPEGSPTLTAQGVEWVGSIALGLGAVMSGFLAFYITITKRAQRGEIPEDIPTADIDDGDPEVGHFSPWSWWPMVLAAGLALMFLGFAVGIWITFLGAPIVLLGVVGWQYEYYRGNFAR